MQLQLNQALMEAYQTSKQELEEKLQKLIAFHTSSPRIFSEIARLKQAIDQGLAQTKTAWNSTTGTFVVPSQEKLAWANTIRAFQKKKEAEEEPDTTGRTYTRIDLGNGTYVWAWSKDGRTLTQDDIQFTVKHDKWAGKDGGLGKMLAQAEAIKAEAKDFDPVKAAKEIADLFTPIGDGVRVVTGKDPITGEKLSGGERGLSLLFIIPLAKVGKYGAKGFKFIAEGMEDINKLNKKADKVKDVEKSTKKASGADKLLKPDLLDELSKSGAKYNPDDVVMVTKNTEKDLLWLEYGNNKAGLNHIEVRHANDFSKRGINNIPEFIYDMLKNKPISIVESSRGLNATYLVNGKKYLIAYGKNGFIVSVYPI